MTYKCELCGKEVEQIPKWEENECPEDTQHFFIKV